MPGTLTISTLSDGTNSTSATNCIQGSAKAWVRFSASGGSISGTVGYNVSSVTRSGTGVYTVNFTNAFADTNYSTVLTAGYLNGGEGSNYWGVQPKLSSPTAVTTGSVGVTTTNNGTAIDTYICDVAIFR